MRRYTIQKRRSPFLGLSATTLLILVNVIFFAFFWILINFTIVSINDVAIKPANIFQGQYLWTFLTSMFMHGSLFHIFANMFSLLFIGTFIERIIGQRRYLYFYLASGLFAGLFFVIVSWIMAQFGYTSDYNTFAVGASGALFGIAGLMMLLTPNIPLYVMFIPVPIKAKYAIPGLLIVLWLISVAGDIPIGNTAHLGGLLAGIFYGMYLRKKYKRKTKYISRHFS